MNTTPTTGYVFPSAESVCSEAVKAQYNHILTRINRAKIRGRYRIRLKNQLAPELIGPLLSAGFTLLRNRAGTRLIVSFRNDSVTDDDDDDEEHCCVRCKNSLDSDPMAVDGRLPDYFQGQCSVCFNEQYGRKRAH
jgi:hypothetical protein